MKHDFIILFFLLLWVFIGCEYKTTGGFKKLEEPIKNIEIEEAIDLVKNEKHKKMLRDFKNRSSEGDSFVVTSHYNHFEIIVSHPSKGDFTGGAEQYFLDKKTGKSKMGWHEHPMAIPQPKKIDKEVH